MVTDRSTRTALPSILAFVVLILGLCGMVLAAKTIAPLRLGVRPTLLISESMLVAPSLLVLALFRIPLGRGLGFSSIPVRTLTLSLASGMALWALSLGLFETQYVFWPPPDGYLEAFQQLHESLRPSGVLEAILSVGAIAVAPAVCEEILFRGVVLPSFATRLPNLWAVLGAALLFGLIHVDATPGAPTFYRVPFAFAVGIGLGTLRVTTGSLFPPILAHALLNTVTFVVAAQEDLTQRPEPHPVLGPLLLAGGLAATAFLLRRIARTRDAPSREQDSATRQR